MVDKWLSHPTSVRIISLVIGILLWAVVHFDSDSPNTVASSTETKVIEAVKIKAEGLDENKLQLRMMEPSVVRLVVSGSRTTLAVAPLEEYQVSVNLNGLSEGIHELPLKENLPGRIQLLQMSPTRVKVELVALQTKSFDVMIRTKGQSALGYKVGEPVVKGGNRVKVTLPKDIMKTVGMVAAVVDIDGKEEAISGKKVKLTVYDTNGNTIKDAIVDPGEVEVEVPITKPSKLVPLRIGSTGELRSGLSLVSIKPEINEVTIYGPQEELDKIEAFQGVAINLAAIKESGTVTANLEPSGNLTVDPLKVNIAIEVTAAETRNLTQLPVTVEGLEAGLQVKFVNPVSGTVNLSVTGAPVTLSKLKESDVQVTADLKGLTPGQHTVSLNVKLPSYLSAGAADPPSVIVDIAAPVDTSIQSDPGNPDSAGDAGANSATDRGNATNESGTAADGQTGGAANNTDQGSNAQQP
jgi:YbbR domain-containing protein